MVKITPSSVLEHPVVGKYYYIIKEFKRYSLIYQIREYTNQCFLNVYISFVNNSQYVLIDEIEAFCIDIY